ncbi:hypothetical protein ACFPRL_11390 [Pseudoclavibacter helvolus]
MPCTSVTRLRSRDSSPWTHTSSRSSQASKSLALYTRRTPPRRGPSALAERIRWQAAHGARPPVASSADLGVAHPDDRERMREAQVCVGGSAGKRRTGERSAGERRTTPAEAGVVLRVLPGA